MFAATVHEILCTATAGTDEWHREDIQSTSLTKKGSKCSCQHFCIHVPLENTFEVLLLLLHTPELSICQICLIRESDLEGERRVPVHRGCHW